MKKVVLLIVSLALLAVSCSQMVYDLRPEQSTAISAEEFYLEKIENTEYELKASVPEKGFYYFTDELIANGDGTFTRKAYYKRVETTITFDGNGGTFEGLTGNYTIKGKYESVLNSDTIPTLTRENYERAVPAWDIELPATFPASDLTIKAQWKPIINEIYLETVTAGDYEPSETLPASGYEYKKTEETVAPDGTRTIKTYYTRKTTTITLLRNGGTFEGLDEDYTVSGRFGTDVTYAAPELTREGYVLSEAEPWGVGALPSAFPASDASYTANWVAITDAIYLENIDDDNFTPATEVPSVGFEYDSETLDGSVNNKYYKRVRSTITFEANGGTFAGITGNYIVNGKYGAATNLSVPEITRTDYVLSSTNPWGVADLPTTFPDANTTLTAQWVAITDEIYLENIADSNYTSATSVPASGFTLDHTTMDGNVRSTYYKRVQTTITFDRNGGTFTGLDGDYTVTGKYGAATNLSVPEITRADYVLSSTNPWGVASLPATFPDVNTTLTAQWVAITDEIYLENIADSKYTKATSVPASGFTLDHTTMDGNVRSTYYKRVQTTITFDRNGGTFTGLAGDYTVTGKYGATVSASIPELKLKDYVLDDPAWDKAIPGTFPAENVTLKAQWRSAVTITPDHTVSDVSITYDSAKNTLKAEIPFGSVSDWTFNWYDNMGTTPIGSTQTLSLASLAKGKHTIVLSAVYDEAVYTKTYEIKVTE